MESSPTSQTISQWSDVFLRRSMHNFFSFARRHGLTMSQLSTLFQIHHQHTCSVSEVGDRLGITNPAASQLLDRLVQQGLVARTEDPSDRRLKQITLTSHGEAVLHEGVRARQQWLTDLVETLTPAEQAVVNQAFTILLDKVNEFDAQKTNHG